jgi:hypothetical protein
VPLDKLRDRKRLHRDRKRLLRDRKRLHRDRKRLLRDRKRLLRDRKRLLRDREKATGAGGPTRALRQVVAWRGRSTGCPTP